MNENIKTTTLSKAEPETPEKTAPKAPEAPVKAEKPKQDTIYTLEEFSAAPGVLGANVDVIRAAFRCAGKKEATLKEAMTIVKKFKESEVK